MLTLAQRLHVPREARALLWDMDGVLIDTLAFDYHVMDDLLSEFVPGHPDVPQELIRSNFAHEPREFFRRILAGLSIRLADHDFDEMLARYEELRKAFVPDVHDGVVEIASDARQVGMQLAVVSNNPEREVRQILSNAGLADLFVEVIGNDVPGLSKKAAPDPYEEAIRRFELNPRQCVAIEDSLLGIESAWRAGCYAIGVSTGANSISELARDYADVCYESFEEDCVCLRNAFREPRSMV